MDVFSLEEFTGSCRAATIGSLGNIGSIVWTFQEEIGFCFCFCNQQ
jgi:hypothetical protein